MIICGVLYVEFLSYDIGLYILNHNSNNNPQAGTLKFNLIKI